MKESETGILKHIDIFAAGLLEKMTCLPAVFPMATACVLGW